MVNINKLVFLVCLLVAGIHSYSQNFTNRGREFWVGYGHHQFMEPQGGTNTQEMVLYIYTGDSAATVTVQLDGSGNLIPPPNGGPWTRTYNIPANTVISIEDPLPAGVTVTKSPNCIQAIGPIPKGGPLDCGFDARLYTCPPPTCSGGEGLFKKKGIHITSTASIVAYSHIYGSVSSGASMLLPVQTWGYNYTCINSDQNNATNAYSWMYIVSQKNNTWVRITPSVPSRNGRPAGIPFDTVLNRGEIYQLVGKLDPGTNPSSGFNLTGTTVKSIDNGTGVCYPIAVFSGSSRTGGEPPCSASQGGGRDNDMQQLFPEQAWGKRYLTAPFSNSGSPASLMQCVYKVAVTDPATIVKVNGVVLTGLISNKYYKFASTTSDYIEANKPVMVAQFMGGGCASGLGDPEMVYLSPIEQAINSIGFYRNTKEAIQIQYLTLIVPTAGVSSLKIDGTLFSAISPALKHSYVHTNLPGYTVCIRQWAATKGASTASSDSAFTAVTYGEGSAESYGYNAGTYLKNLNALPSIKNQLDTSKQSDFTCTGTNVRLSALLAYTPTQISWKLSQVKHLFRASNYTPVLTDTTVGDGVTLMTATDTFNINGRDYYQFPLGYYQFDSLGKYKIPITVKNPSASICNPFEDFELEIEVRQKPVADFVTIAPGCPTDSVKFLGAGSGGGYTIKGWFWEFPQGNPSADSSQNTGYIFPGPGSYPVKLTVASLEGCTDDTVKIVTIAPGVTTSFTVAPNVLCQGGTVTVTPGPTTTTEWYWDFGDGTLDTTYNGNPFTHTYTTYGAYSITHSIKSSGTCNIGATPQPVTVNANPFASFTINPPGCLPANGVVQFTSTATAPDGQVINGHAWNFGDPNATVPNPNTSTLASPTHQYSGVGTYNITYRATAVNGCFTDTLVTAVFNVTPAVTYPVLPNVCLNTPPFPVNSGSVTNGVPVTEIYSGPGIINGATGLFDPSVAGIGTHTIWYHATSTAGGCTDSVSQTITVNGLPKVGFTFPTGCLANGTVQFTDTTVLPAGSTPPINYSWNFDDLPSGANNVSVLQNPSHNYTTSGPFNVKLVVGVNGCSDSATVPVLVRIQPQLSYPPLPTVCGNVAPFAVNTATVTNGVAGTGVYSGPGITNGTAGTFDPLIAGFGTHTIKYIFTSALGCIDSVQTTIIVSQVPQAGFTFPVGCLPNGNVQFGDTSKPVIVPNTKTYQWNFGDASPVNNQVSPLHLYLTDGLFNVKQVVTLNGCTDSITVPVTVRIQPILSYPALASVCGNVPAFAVNTATVTNGVVGTGIYSGPGITNGATGTFDPAVAGIGTHTIKYIFTSGLGCIDSVQSTLTVSQVPQAGFTFPVNCLPNGNVQFGDTSKPVIVPNTKSYQWNFGDGSPVSNQVAPSHLYVGSGPFPVKQVVTLNGCSDSVTVPVTVRIQPQLSYPALTSVCGNVPPFAVNSAAVTNGVAGAGVYSGPGITNGVAGTFNPSVAGIGTHTIKYIFTSALGCIDSVQTTIAVKTVPKAGFTFPVTCLSNGNVQFGDTSKPVIVPNIKSYQWNFGDGSPISIQAAPTHLYVGSGPFPVKQVVSLNGCSDSVTVPVTVRIQPMLSYSLLNPVCANTPPLSVASGSVTNGVTGFGVYSGTGITNGATGIFNPALAGIGTHTIKYTFTSLLGCIDSVQTTITVKAVPVASFTYPTGCLTSNVVPFVSSPVSGGTYSWNFGDPPSGANNTSNGANPTHTYNIFGTYIIKFTVTSNGCTDDTTVNATFRLQPVINFPTIPSVCQADDTIAVNLATVTNGVPAAYSGKYSGPGIIDTLGKFNPLIAGAGTHTITYTFTSNGGCIASKTSTITVWPRPAIVRIAFNNIPDSNICIDKALVVSSQVLISSGTVVTWHWNMGDGFDTLLNSNASLTYKYDTAKSYKITLTAISNNGCASTSSAKIVFVRGLPDVSFVSPTGVCMPNGSVAFQNTTSIPLEDSTTLTYLWDFGDNTAKSALMNPVHIYNSTQPQAKVRLDATSVYGCKSADSAIILFYPKPIAKFSVSPVTVCQGKPITLTNLTTSPNISSATWDLGDGSNPSSAITPVVIYSGTGDYQPSLFITSNNGCKDTAVQNVKVYLQPIVDAGKSFVVNAGTKVTFQGQVNAPNLNLAWTPPTGLSNTHIINPSLNVVANQTYRLTAIGDGGCTATDTMTVNVLFALKIPNAFSPNGDGKNDTWEVANLKDYPGVAVEVFNRYGQSVFLANGKYNKAWDGTFNGKILPAGTYYYIIDLKNGTQPVAGYVAIIK